MATTSDDSTGCLVDTNVLIRFADPTDPGHPDARRSVLELRKEHLLCVASQNLIECWNVMTRPKNRNGFGHSIAQADLHLGLIEKLFPRLSDPVGLFSRWRELVVRFSVSGVQVHDARLVAFMLCHRLTRILTFDAADFRRYSELGIEAIDPRDLSGLGQR